MRDQQPVRRRVHWHDPPQLSWVDRHPHWATLLIAAAVAGITAAVLLLGS
jgi:hypothetical protein